MKDLKEKRGAILLTPEEAEKQAKQFSLFGTNIDINLSKNGTLIPFPAVLNATGNYESGFGTGGNFVIPLVPFPLGLIFPSPPLNISVGLVTNKNMSFAVNASAGTIFFKSLQCMWDVNLN